jgi:cytochrome c-type biogenesis protein CcmH/NrfG
MSTQVKEHGAMTQTSRIEPLKYRGTKQQAMVLAGVCLVVGIGGGWLIRGMQNTPGAETAQAAGVTEKVPSPASQSPDPARLKAMADAQAAPLVAKLASEPANPDLLTSIGNLYYDAQQYPAAIDYYGRELKVRPADVGVRTDMATAWWYTGNADTAIAEFNTALTYAPANANTLFNLGLVKWKGKADGAGAVGAWDKLLKANPNYEGKDKVEQMMAEVKQHAAAK